MTVFQKNNIVEEALHPKQDRYAIYLRKSRADMELEAMGEGETLARHQKMLTALASRHEIHPDQITIYKEVVSGDSLDERPQMQQLLSDVYAKKFKAVLVVEIERLARGSTKDQGEVADAFQSTGTKIITPLKIYDPAIESDQEYFEFGLFMSRREYKTINRRQQSGKHQSVREGNYILPQRVFGYEIVRLTKRDRTLKPIPDEVKLVKMIFDWYTEERRTTGWIARHMTLMGIPTIKNRPEWNRGTIRDMLSNPIYIGKVTWGKRKTVKEFDPELGKLVKVVKEDGQQEIYEGKHPGIISNEQFEKAQWVTEIGKNPSAKISTELINPLAGLMECCECGRNIVAVNFGGNRRTRISHARDTICQKKSLPMDEVIEAFAEALQAYIADFEMKMEADDNTADREKHLLMLSSMEAELAKLEKKRKQLFADYEDRTYTRDEFIERKQHYNELIEELKKQVQEAQESIPEPVDYSEKIKTLHAMIDCVKDPNLSAKNKNDFLKQFISKITYDAIDYGRRKGGKAVLEVFLK
jgi:DNA invertase Pin-like site-specific DNA recombinase